MEITLENILFEYFLKNNLENLLSDFKFINYLYLEWKKKYYTKCSCCSKLIKKEYKCQICLKYYYCLECFDNYTYYCFYCNKHHCFMCNIKRKACRICYYN